MDKAEQTMLYTLHNNTGKTLAEWVIDIKKLTFENMVQS